MKNETLRNNQERHRRQSQNNGCAPTSWSKEEAGFSKELQKYQLEPLHNLSLICHIKQLQAAELLLACGRFGEPVRTVQPFMACGHQRQWNGPFHGCGAPFHLTYNSQVERCWSDPIDTN
jgi:hypothetical protein